MFLLSLLGFLSVRLGCHLVVVGCVSVGCVCLMAGRILSYDVQDLLNNLAMYSALVWLDCRPHHQLWFEIICLAPAQLIRLGSKGGVRK